MHVVLMDRLQERSSTLVIFRQKDAAILNCAREMHWVLTAGHADIARHLNIMPGIAEQFGK